MRRARLERREGTDLDRTVGFYDVLHDGQETGLRGMTVESGGPGSNGLEGRAVRSCIAIGSYPLLTRETIKYRTTGFRTDGPRPWPALQVGETGERRGILVHAGWGYRRTIGCILISGPLAGPHADIPLHDSLRRVTEMIADMEGYIGRRVPAPPNIEIQSVRLVIEDMRTIR